MTSVLSINYGKAIGKVKLKHECITDRNNINQKKPTMT